MPSYKLLKEVEQPGPGKDLDSGKEVGSERGVGSGKDVRSWKRVGSDKNAGYELVIEGNTIRLDSRDGQIAYVDISDVLPSPKNGFVLYLLVDSSNKVLSRIGGERALSIVDSGDISLKP